MRRPRRTAALLLSGGVVLGVLVGTGVVAGAAPGRGHAAASPSRTSPKGATPKVSAAALSRLAPVPAAASHRVSRLASSLLPAAGLAPRPVGASARGVPLPDSRGQIGVYVSGEAAAVRAAVAAAGGTVTIASTGVVQARVPADRLVALATATGVTQVRPPAVAHTEAVTSEGVAASSADVWQGAQSAGAGVKIGIIDAGYATLAAAQAAGEIPNDVTTFHNCHDPNTGADLFDQTSHGTAVAEIVHDMAPAATLFLACINDSLEFGQAEALLRQQGVKVINTSLTFSGISRGDGTGDESTPAGVVKRSRQAGILWSVSAGNQALVHFGGTVRDVTGAPGNKPDGFVELTGTDQNQGFAVAPGGAAFISLQWDAWPTTRHDLDLIVTDAAGNVVARSINDQAGTPGGLPPVEETVVVNPSTTDEGIFFAFVAIFDPTGPVRYDLTAFDADAVEHSVAAGSVGEPATSPYVIAAGAVDVADNSLESFSSQGPTIDGRVKPDLAGYDGVSTLTFGPPGATTGFFGTSASAPHIAGAAALILGKNPQLDASGVERELFSRALPATGGPNAVGRGRLTMAPTDQAPTRAPDLAYTALPAPTRILDTRHGTGGRSTPLGAGEVFALQVAGVAGVPADAKALVVNLTGVGATSNTDLSVFPTTFTGTSNLNLVRNAAAANLVTATIGADGKVRVRNAAGTVQVIMDVVGYYRVDGGGFTTPATPVRVLDTRTGVGGTTGKVGPNQTITLTVRGVAGVPAGATAVVLNLTGTQPTTVTDLSVFPDTFTGTSNLNLAAGATRANLVVATIGADGKVRIRNAGGMVHVIADLAGWFQPNVGSRYVPITPLRILDTRTGNGLKHGPFTANQVFSLQAARIYTVPFDATGVVLNVTGVGPSVATFLTLFPAGTARPNTSNVNLAAGQVVPNSVYASVGTNGQVNIANSAGSISVLADLAGYFQPSN